MSETSSRPNNGPSSTTAEDAELKKLAFQLWQAFESEYPGLWLKKVGPVLNSRERMNHTAKRWALAIVGAHLDDVGKAISWLCTGRENCRFLPQLNELRTAIKSYSRARRDREAHVTELKYRLEKQEPTAEQVERSKTVRTSALAEAFGSLGVNYES